MLTKNIKFKNFNKKKKDNKVKNDLILYLKQDTEIAKSLSSKYKNNYKKGLVNILKKFKKVKVIGMGGSILGAKSIYEFLKFELPYDPSMEKWGSGNN